jgi:hypothetical protein
VARPSSTERVHPLLERARRTASDTAYRIFAACPGWAVWLEPERGRFRHVETFPTLERAERYVLTHLNA